MDALPGLLPRHAGVHHHLRDGDGFFLIAGLLQMRRHRCHDAQEGPMILGKDGQLTAQKHPLVHAAHSGEAQKALGCHLRDHKTDLVDVRVQQNRLCAGNAAIPPAQNVAQGVDLHPVAQRPHQLGSHRADPVLVAGDAIALCQAADHILQGQMNTPRFLFLFYNVLFINSPHFP